MAKGRVRIPLVADASGVKKGTAQARRDLATFDKSAKTSAGGLSALTASAGGAGLLIGGGLALGIHTAVDAFKEQEKQNARTSATLKTLGIDTEGVRKQIEGVLGAQVKLTGFQDNELKGSFATLLTSTHSVTDALHLNSLAANLARGRQIDLSTAARIVAKVVDGNVGILNRYGVKIEKGTSVTDALAAAQKRYAGQAKEFGDTTAGSAEKASAQIDQLEEKLGGQLAPALNEVAGATLHFAGTTSSLIDEVGGLGPLIAGGAGFGAFKLVAPSLLDAGSAVGALSRVAGAKGAGASFRVLGSAVADSVSPMALAAGGAAILGAGIYEIWKNSENADQAVAGLNQRLDDLKGATQQRDVAKNQVNSAKDYVKATAESVKAAHGAAQAQHEQVAELTRDVAARKADVAALREHGAEAGKITEAQNKVTSSQNKLAGATAKWQKSLAEVVPAVHAHQTAVTNLKSAQTNLELSTDGVRDAQDKLAQKSRDVIEKANDAARATTGVANALSRGFAPSAADSAKAAGKFADMMDKAAGAAKSSDTTTKNADSALALFARHMGRLPTVKEIRVALTAAAAGKSIDDIQRKLDHLQSKQITIRFNQTFGNTGNPINPTNVPKSATGAYVAGSYAAGDVYPAMVSGEEAILNPTQISMVDGGMSVMGALRATGAPVIGGGGFATGAVPAARANVAKWKKELATDSKAKNAAETWLYANADGSSKGTTKKPNPKHPIWQARYDKLHAPGKGLIDQVQRDSKELAAANRALAAAIKGRERRVTLSNAIPNTTQFGADIDAFNAKLSEDAYANTDPLGNLSAAERTDLGNLVARYSRRITTLKSLLPGSNKTRRDAINQELASDYDAIRGYRDQLNAAPNTAAGGDGPANPTDTGAPADTGPTPDQQAQIDQANARTAVAVRGSQLSDAALRTLTGSGDIGEGGYANALDAGRGGPKLAILGDQRSLLAMAGAANQGNGLQPSISANRSALNI